MPDIDENNFAHPENYGCAYFDEKGVVCAIGDCAAKAWLRNIKDIQNPQLRRQKEEKIVSEAKSKGCPNV